MDNQNANNQTANNQVENDQVVNNQTANNQSANNQSANNQTANNQGANNQSAPEKAVFCGACGTKLSEGDVVCYKCGAPTGGAPAEETPAAEPKKKGWFMRHIKAISIITAIVAVLGAGIYFAYPYISNAIVKATTTDEEYFAKKLTEKTETLSSDIVSVYGFAKTGLIEGMKSDSQLTLKKGEGLSTFLDDTGLSPMVSEYVDWLDEVSLTSNTSFDQMRLSSELGLSINGADLGTFASVMDLENGEMYMGLPGYNDSYMYQRLGSAGIDYADVVEVVEALPEEDVVEDIINKYILCVAESIEKVEVTDATFKASGVSQDAEKYTVDIDSKTVINILKNVLAEVKADEDIKQTIENIADLYGLDTDEFYEILDEAEGEFADIPDDAFGDFVVELSLYVDSKGEVIGITVEMEDAFEIVAGAAVDGSDVGILYKVSAGGATISLGGTGTGSISGSLDAVLDLKVSVPYTSMPTAITLVSIELDGVDGETGEGEYIIRVPLADLLKLAGESVPSSAQPFVNVLGDMDIHIVSEGDFAGEISIRYKEEPMLTLSTSAEFETGVDVETPSDVEENPGEWAENFDFDELYSNIEAIGLPDMFMDYVDEAFEDLPY